MRCLRPSVLSITVFTVIIIAAIARMITLPVTTKSTCPTILANNQFVVGGADLLLFMAAGIAQVELIAYAFMAYKNRGGR